MRWAIFIRHGFKAHASGECHSYVCLLSCVPHASTVLSKHGVSVEPLFCLGFWARLCLRKGGGGQVRGQLCKDMLVGREMLCTHGPLS